MAEPIVQASALTKRYGNLAAVDRLNLDVEAGEVYGMLGPNGSGKTTTILMLLGLTEPTGGKVRVLGLDPARKPLSVKARVGYLPDQIGFYDNLTAQDNLIYIARLNGLSREEGYRRIDSALARMGLGEVATHPVRTYSRGMRQRLGVAELLLKQPQIIIMDEPTLGLDPEAAHRFLQTIRDLKEEGITILLVSPLLHQVQIVCDRVGLFRRGKIAIEGAVDELAQQVLGGAYRVKLQAEGKPDSLEQALRAVSGVREVVPNGADWYMIEATSDLRPETAEAVMRAGGRLKALDMEIPSLDEIYSQYFGEDKMEVQYAEPVPTQAVA